jgi:hypothetical protein
MTAQRRWFSGCVAAVAVVVASSADGATAQPPTASTGPSVSASVDKAAPGEQLTIRIAGFTTNAVTVSVCGNEGRRGSSDCNLPASLGVSNPAGGVPVEVLFTVSAPPTTCPCVIRASDNNNDQVAVVPIRVIGHPLGPVEGAPDLEDSITMSVDVADPERTALEMARAGLGGPIAYELTVTIKNRTTVALRNVILNGSVGAPDADNPDNVEIANPDVLQPGETYVATATHEVPAMQWGELQWTVTALGTGNAVAASDTTSRQPTMLVFAVAFACFALFLIPLRHVVARHKRRREQRELEDLMEAGEGRQLIDV